MKKRIIIRTLSSILILFALALNVSIISNNTNKDFNVNSMFGISSAQAEDADGQMYEDKFYIVIGLDPSFWVCCEEDVTDGCWSSMWPVCP